MNNPRIVKWIFYASVGLLIMMTLLMWLFAGEYTTVNLVLSGLCAVLMGAICFLERAHISELFRSTTFKNGASDLVGLFLIFCILALINYLVFMNNRSIDVTQTKVHTLTDQSQMVVANFKAPVKISLFAKRETWENYFQLLNQYKLSNPKVEITAIDIEEHPALAKIQGVTEDGSVVINYQDRKVVGKAESELAVTNLFLKLQSTRTITVGYTFGHGEIDLSIQERNGGSFLRDKILERNYQLTKIDLLGAGKINQKVDLLLMLGPVNGLLDMELEKVREYLADGGNLMLSLAPNFDKKDWKNLLDLVSEYGALVTNTIVLDRLAQEQGTDATTPIIVTFNPESRITRDVSGRLVFPLTAAIIPTAGKGVKYHWLARSTSFPASWAESDLVGVVKGTATASDKDIRGPVDVVAVTEHGPRNSKVGVWGSTAALVNGQAPNALNFNLFFNAVSWLVDDEGIMALSRPGLTGERIFLAQAQMSLIFWGSIVLIPFVLGVFGIYFYRRRLVK